MFIFARYKFCYQQIGSCETNILAVAWSLNKIVIGKAKNHVTLRSLLKHLRSPIVGCCSTELRLDTGKQALSRFVASLQSSFGSLESAAKQLSLGDPATTGVGCGCSWIWLLWNPEDVWVKLVTWECFCTMGITPSWCVSKERHDIIFLEWNLDGGS